MCGPRRETRIVTWRGLVLISGAALGVWGTPLDLTPPTPVSFFSQIISYAPGDSRGALFQANSSSQIDGAGIRFDPLTGGLTSLRLSIFSVTINDDGYALGPELASADAGVSDSGMAFYDVPLNFMMNAGSLYYLSFSDPTEGGWGNGRNEMEFFYFDAATASPYAAGAFEVIDGGAFPGNSAMGFSNIVIPHIRLLTGDAPPEDSVPPESETSDFVPPDSITPGSVHSESVDSDAVDSGGVPPDSAAAFRRGAFHFAADPMLAPVPEPSPVAMMLGAMCLGGYLRKRARSRAAILTSSSR